MSTAEPVHHGDRHRRRQILHGDLHQRASLEPVFDHAARRQRQAQRLLRQLEVGNGVGRLDLRHDGRQAMLQQHLFHHHPRVGRPRRQYPCLVAQRPPVLRDSAGRGQAVRGRADHGPLLGAYLVDHEAIGPEPAELGRRVHRHQHVDVAGLELLAHVGQPALHEPHGRQSTMGGHIAQQARHQRPGNERRRPDADGIVGRHAPRRQLVGKLGHFRQQDARTLNDEIAGSGRDHTARQAVEHGHAEQGLDLPQPLADRRRAHVQPLARGSHVAGIGQRTDQFQLAHPERGQQPVCRVVHSGRPDCGARSRAQRGAYLAAGRGIGLTSPGAP